VHLISMLENRVRELPIVRLPARSMNRNGSVGYDDSAGAGKSVVGSELLS